MNTRYLFAGIAALSTLAAGAYIVQAQMMTRHDRLHVQHGGHGMGHDEHTMPGLRGANTTATETAEMQTLFRNFTLIEREVSNLENGIAVTQTSNDPGLVSALHRHAAEVSDMVDRGMQAVHERMMN